MHRMWTAVRKDLLFLAYLVAMPRHLLRHRNAFSTRWRSLYRSSSYALWVTRFFFGWDHGIHTLRCGLLKKGVGIVPFVRDQMIGVDPFNQAACLRAIRPGTFCNNDSDRHALRIHGQMYLGIEAPFVRPMSWFPPLAPAAWGWTLQWLASIISHS